MYFTYIHTRDARTHAPRLRKIVTTVSTMANKSKSAVVHQIVLDLQYYLTSAALIKESVVGLAM